MKTNTFVIPLSIILLSFTGNDRKHKTGWEIEQLKGKVRSCHIKWFHAVMDNDNSVKEDKMPYYESYFLFDVRGNEVESGDNNVLDHKRSRAVNTYDAKGNCVKTRVCEYIKADSTIQIAVNTFDEKGNKIESQAFASSTDITPVKILYKYDANGNLLKWVCVTGKDTVPGQHEYRYDNMGNMIEDDEFNATENMLTSTINTYDAKGVKTETTETWYNKSDIKKAVCQYDEHGNVLQGEEYGADNTIVAKGSFKITYDKIGNRVKQVEFKNNKPVTVTEYKIVYYN